MRDCFMALLLSCYRDWNNLSGNPSITFEDVVAHPEKPWNWYRLSLNTSTTFHDVVAHPNKPWGWAALSRNPQMLFTKAEEAQIGKTRLVVSRIQRRWRVCITDPSHPVCRRRLMRELEDMTKTG